MLRRLALSSFSFCSENLQKECLFLLDYNSTMEESSVSNKIIARSINPELFTSVFKAYMNSDILLQTVVIFLLSTLYPKQGIS